MFPFSVTTHATANGTHIPIIGRDNVSFLSSLYLKVVLYVPNLSNNLIFIKKLIHDLKCYVTFFLLIVFSRILLRGGHLVPLRNKEGCIVLTTWVLKIILVNTRTFCLQSYTTFESSQIWLLHCRLGHSSFPVLKFMFPFLFSKKFVVSFRCDVCQRGADDDGA